MNWKYQNSFHFRLKRFLKFWCIREPEWDPSTLLYMNGEGHIPKIPPLEPFAMAPGINFTYILVLLFCTKVFCADSLYLQFVFVSFWQKHTGEKAACRTLVKLTTPGVKNSSLTVVVSAYIKICDFLLHHLYSTYFLKMEDNRYGRCRDNLQGQREMAGELSKNVQKAVKQQQLKNKKNAIKVGKWSERPGVNFNIKFILTTVLKKARSF